MKVISYRELLKEKDYILIDVRSPGEYEAEGIPGSINIPILLDEERAVVGTAYKQISPEKAKFEGINFFAERLPEIFEEINRVSKEYKKLVFYCARGGMRSSIMTSFFGAMGYRVSKLDAGYKGYREFITEEVPKLNKGVEYIVIHGQTGVGKTKLLNELERRGYSVLDLEKLADHKGSFFGALHEKRVQSQKRFDSLIYEFFKNNSPKYVLAESESKRIGNVYVPECIYQSLIDGKHFLADAPMDLRVKIVMEDYFIGTPSQEIHECILKTKKYLPVKIFEEYEELLELGKRDLLAQRLMEDYYDVLYQKCIDKYNFDEIIKYSTIKEGADILEKILVEKYLPKIIDDEKNTAEVGK